MITYFRVIQGILALYMGYLWSGQGQNTIFGTPHIGYQISFSKYSSNQHFQYRSILGQFWAFWAVLGYFSGCGRVRNLFQSLNIQIENFQSFIIPIYYILMLTKFRVILGILGLYLGKFGVEVGSENCFGVSLYRPSTFVFSLTLNSFVFSQFGVSHIGHQLLFSD